MRARRKVRAQTEAQVRIVELFGVRRAGPDEQAVQSIQNRLTSSQEDQSDGWRVASPGS